jgi:formate hydrogenlyase transcriptional activator
MAVAADKNYRALVRLCQAARAAEDGPTLCRQAVEALHELTGCARVGLFLSSDLFPNFPGIVVEFTGRSETPAPPDGSPTVRWVLAHRQPRRDESEPDILYMPLTCRGVAVGVLALVDHPDGRTASWDRALLQNFGGLLALALENLSDRARAAEWQRLQQETVYLRDTAKAERDLRPLTGESPAMKAVRRAFQQVAPTDSTVLILGETGTGKELVARAIHQLSPRRDHLLVVVNCAALAPGVIASELFGHEAGRSRARPSADSAASSWPTAALSFSMKSASCRRKRR